MQPALSLCRVKVDAIGSIEKTAPIGHIKRQKNLSCTHIPMIISTSDVYKPVIRKGKASDKEMMWTGRIVVLGIAVAALIIASNPNAGSIMALVSNAWGIFGAAFGPAIMLSLFWKRFNFKGAVAGIVTGAAVDILWYAFLTSTGIYELLPGFVFGLIAAVVVTLCTKEPSKEVYELFDKAQKFDE